MNDQEQHNRYDELARKLLDGSITESEKQEYFNWLNREEEPLNIPAGFAKDRGELKNRIYNAVHASIKDQASADAADSRRINKQRSLYRYAAAAVLLIVAGFATYFLISRQSKPQTVSYNNKPVATDVLPGSNGAVLTLANGQQLLLDSLGNGVVATQGKTNISVQNGQLVYDVQELGPELFYNTMTTPKGRQFQLQLPDGSKVWLNAASSITYPVAFIGKERLVKVTGEAYFEVAKNKEKPFIVDVDGKANVQALGTSFNINAYEDEPDVKTTLLEGKVKMWPLNNGQSAMLKPGEQVSLSQTSQLFQPIPVQTEEVMAWKNGRFEFNGNSIQSVMRQLSRWYDVDVVYEGRIPEDNFMGAIARQEKLSQVLKMLELTNVIKFKIQKKTATGEAAQIIVMRK
jgi:transmembrane sensor